MNILSQAHHPCGRLAARFLSATLLLFCCFTYGLSTAQNPFGFAGEQQTNYEDSVIALDQIVADKQQGNKSLRNKVFGGVAQTKLSIIYQDNNQYQAENSNSANLRDNVIGPITEKWLAYFSTEFAIKPIDGNQQYAQNLFESLIIVSEIKQRYPDWRDIIVSDEFKQWLTETDSDYQQCHALPGCYGSPTNLHHLLDEYHIPRIEQDAQEQYIKWIGVHYHLSAKAYEKLAAEDELATDEKKRLSEEQLAALETLIGTYFAQWYLVDVALKTLGVTDLNDDQRKSIVKAMEKQGAVRLPPLVKTREGVTAEKYLQTAIWQPLEDCGCASKISSEEPRYFYGFYPYWQDATDTIVNFEQLTRIGYFAATLDGENELFLPQSWTEEFEGGWQDGWQKEQPYSEMVAMAHKYRVKVDLVVANQRTRGQKAQYTPNYFFSQALVRRIVNEVKTPLAEQTVNPLKPMLSFNFSPERTKADGVTLDLDLHGAGTDEQVNLVVEFVKALKDGLMEGGDDIVNQLASNLLSNGGASNEGNSNELLQQTAAQGSVSNVSAAPSDPYYLNMMVPVKALLANAQASNSAKENQTKAKDVGFYTLDNLQKVSDSVNIFIMVFDPLTVKQLMEKTQDIELCNSLGADKNSVGLMKCLRRYLGQKDNAEIAGKLHAKMVPLLQIPEDAKEDNSLQKVLDYNNWSYKGAAYWHLPLGEASSELISATYFPDQGLTDNTTLIGPVINMANQVCDQLCPNRWVLRVLLFVLFVCIVLYAVLSIWIFKLRQYLVRWYSMAFMFGCCVFLTLLFTCDPYWQEQQQLILFAFVLFFIATILLYKVNLDTSARYP